MKYIKNIDKNRIVKLGMIIFIMVLAITSGICIYFEWGKNGGIHFSPDMSQTDNKVDIFEPDPFINEAEPESYPFQVIAHRGFSSKAPQNTMAAFKMAASYKCEQIELDVQLSKDGVVVVYHDDNLKYITGVEGPVSDYTYDELRQFDAGSKFNKEKYAGEKIPSLEMVLEYVQGQNIMINLELKNIGNNPIFVSRVVDLVKQYELEEKVIFSSFNYDYLYQIKLSDPNLKIELVSKSGDGWFLIENYPADYYNLMLSEVDKTTIDVLHDAGAKVFVWTVNDRVNMKKALNLGVDGIVTNYPNLLLEVLERPLH